VETKDRREKGRGVNANGLRDFKGWIESLGRTTVTGWRWRRDGWIQTVNIAGRVYVSDASITEFTRRAEAGEFAKEHKAPRRATA